MTPYPPTSECPKFEAIFGTLSTLLILRPCPKCRGEQLVHIGPQSYLEVAWLPRNYSSAMKKMPLGCVPDMYQLSSSEKNPT